jgi:hypothetical protein
MLCPASAFWIVWRSICIESTVCSKSVVGPLIRMWSWLAIGEVNSTTATEILGKKCVMCPISIMFSSKRLTSCLVWGGFEIKDLLFDSSCVLD